MTMGQRIAQKRKELGLSQEALGERLGVSRQAIYKWESDAALPEIEKLVNLSREFNVSVGWLLGEEGEAQERPELTPEQLRMVEEIVGRYLAAQPAPPAEQPAGEAEPDKPQQRRWPLALARAALVIGAVALAAALAYGVWFSKLDQIRMENQNLQSQIASIRSDVSQQIHGITSRVEEILQSQNTLTAEHSAQVLSTDYRANTVTVAARAVPRTYVEGMTAQFILASGGEAVTVPGELGEDCAFTAQLTGPLSDDITVSVAFLTGDQRQTQTINQLFLLYTDSFPIVEVNGSLWGSGNTVRESCEVRTYTESERNAEIVQLRLGLFRDRQLLAWYEHTDRPEGVYTGDWSGIEFFRLEESWTMEPGHEYCAAAVLTDEYGREWVRPDRPVVYDLEQNFADYVDRSGYTTDPADWVY